MRDHDTVSYFDVLDAITDGQSFASSLVPDNARKLRMDRVEPAGDEQVAIIDRCVLNANQELTRFGLARFRNLDEAKTFIRFTVFRQLDGLHQRFSYRKTFCSLSVFKLDQIYPGEAVSDLLCAPAFA